MLKGAFVLVLLVLLCPLLVCCATAKPRSSPVQVRPLSVARLRELGAVPFDAFHTHTKHIAVVRVPGTPAHDVVRDYIISVLNKTRSFSASLDVFIAATPKGTRAMTNVVATWNPYNRTTIVLAAHYDSKWFPDPNTFVAASDSAVSCAMLLDLAHTLDDALVNAQAASTQYGLQLVFFDGEEAFEEWSNTDSIYGARHLASLWGRPTLDRIELFVLLDLIGVANPRFLDFFPATSRQFQDLTFQVSANVHYCVLTNFLRFFCFLSCNN
jgi:glutaminyl-peptide cyclotransferase